MASPITFVKQTHQELKKVVWPKREDVIRLTLIVLLVSVLVGLYIGALDYILTFITEVILGINS